MFSFPRSKSVVRLLGLSLFSLAFASTSQAACLLPDGPPNTLVPDGYHYSVDGNWRHCQKGAWTVKEKVTKERPYTPNETGVCLPLENQFTKKNGVISMNFVPEKTVRNFYGFEHECVASTWWRVPGGATASDISKIAEPEPIKEKDDDPLKGLEDFYKTETTSTVDSKTPSSPPPPSKPEVPSFSAEAKKDSAKPPVIPPSKISPPSAPVVSKDNAPPRAPEFSFREPSSAGKTFADYKACQVNCRKGMDQRIKNAEGQCKREIRNRLGQGQWSAKAEKDFRRCRILAARKENNELRACLLPCKKQAGQNVWMGP